MTNGSPRFLAFSTDLDGTLLGNPEATARFARIWHSIPTTQRPRLIYNTGRSIGDTQAVVAARGLPAADYVIGGVGTELHAPGLTANGEFQARFGEGWDRATVDRIVATNSDAKPQPVESTHPYKSSWFWPRAPHRELDHLQRCFGQAGLVVTLVYSCHYFLDVVPARAGKGKALAWLCERLRIPLTAVLVAGDAANDSSMFLLPGVHGIVVENALPELLADTVGHVKFIARTAFADGVIDGLKHFGVTTGAGLIGSPAN